LETRDLYWHYPHYGNQGGDPSSMIRSGDWKLISYHEDDRDDELYNLVDDIGEQNDVAAANPDMVTEMKAKLDAWLKDRGALFPESDSAYDPEARKAVFEKRATEGMARLEERHAAFLNDGWEPNSEWWGSEVTPD
jgi:arylsulfatase A-like enzyme